MTTTIEMQQKIVRVMWNAGMDVSHTCTNKINVTTDDGEDFYITITRVGGDSQ